MNNEPSRKPLTHSTWFQFFLLIILLLGVFFRFFHLDYKLYWIDETFTSLRISGYTKSEMVAELAQGKVFDIKDLYQYQAASPQKNILGTIKGLATEEPQHPPLYFVMARVWGRLFGNSVAITRTLPALISLLVLPGIYWLSQELFAVPMVGLFAIAIVAVSPIQVLYAQESRQYGLWAVLTLASSIALLRAMRKQTKRSWLIYAITVAAGMYTFFFAALVTIGHGIYILALRGLRLSRTIIAYFLASLAGLAMFAPWLYLSQANFEKVSKTTGWAAESVPLGALVQTWLLNLGRLFWDINSSINRYNLLLYVALAIFVGYAIYFLYRRAPKEASLFIITLIGVSVLALVIPDLINGGKRSSVARYFIPSYLGIELAVAYLLAMKIAIFSHLQWGRRFWSLVLTVLITAGIFSCFVSSQAVFWWNKYTGANHHQVAEIINQSSQPLILTQSLEIVSLSYLLEPKVKFYWLAPQKIKSPNQEVRKQLVLPEEIDIYSDVFFFNSSQKLRDAVTKISGYPSELMVRWEREIEPVYQVNTWLWKLKSLENSE